MSKVWVNGKFFTSENKKSEGWTPPPNPEKILWGLCPSCGAVICEGDTVAMLGDHDKVACIACFDTIPGAHVDCVGLRLPDLTLSQ